MKMKNEEEENENFSNLQKIFWFIFSETSNYADFKYVFRFVIYFYDQKLQPSKVRKNGQKTGKNRQNGPTLKGYNFGWKQDMNNVRFEH